MARVIDTIQITEKLRRNVPGLEVPFEGDGLLVILDPDEGTDVAGADGQQATITRSDGTRIDWMIAGSAVRHRVPSLYFRGLMPGEVPRLAEISWRVD